jgi:hypothetical protein
MKKASQKRQRQYPQKPGNSRCQYIQPMRIFGSKEKEVEFSEEEQSCWTKIKARR